jgi:NAD(P)-dependent dehydrogenase (short-subunit alcohol dehydrogenase family)
MATQKTVLVTGANQGLGFAIVSIAATRDSSAHYILACRNLEAGATAIDELKKSGIAASLELLQLDVTKDAEIVKAVESVTERHGRLDGKSITLCSTPSACNKSKWMANIASSSYQ